MKFPHFWTILLPLYCSNVINAAPIEEIEEEHEKPFDLNRIETLYSFGDSYTTQNLDLLSMTYACANCTSAGGRNWVEYLVDLHPMEYWNLAYNSAPISNNLVGQNSTTVTDVTTQITSLFPKYLSKASHNPYTTLHTIWVGINDINLTADWDNTDELDEILMEQYKVLVEYLMIKHNARQFVLISVPPIDRSLKWQIEGLITITKIKRRVHDFNKKLKSLIKHLHSLFPGHYYLYDAWDTFTTILDHPEDYNITHTTDYCPDWSFPVENNCSSIEQYFWYNDLHPTYKIHEYVAQDLYKFLKIHSSNE
ncbi:hypothetical protein BDA99DRAFT_455807 [Phascolomyces articulosus]|uniref:Carbohydrate esterase family 16 protein n=1 Tax=Phascolomyces articulosus TaxID=60185 RepID=A0AAD5KCQ9_9FUNG|nr:hypothetical protein BDA99DRAFT_455807 [Phascolomyces articulosus]